MLPLTQQILIQKFTEVVDRIKQNILTTHTGNYVPLRERRIMADSVYFEITDNGVNLWGGKWIFTYENGRGPTVNPGDGAVRRNALEYIREEGILSKYLTKDGKEISQETLAYFVSKKIHNEGTILFREKRQSGILSSVINEQLTLELNESLLYEFEQMITSKLLAA